MNRRLQTEQLASDIQQLCRSAETEDSCTLDTTQVQDWCSTCMLGLLQKKDLVVLKRESQANDSVLIVKHGKPPQRTGKVPFLDQTRTR